MFTVGLKYDCDSKNIHGSSFISFLPVVKGANQIRRLTLCKDRKLAHASAHLFSNWMKSVATASADNGVLTNVDEIIVLVGPCLICSLLYVSPSYFLNLTFFSRPLFDSGPLSQLRRSSQAPVGDFPEFKNGSLSWSSFLRMKKESQLSCDLCKSAHENKEKKILGYGESKRTGLVRLL